ncbi:MAG: response regulator [Opitutaceae bacterium]|nr:response regulator [Opitutaceae bacterium]
MNPATLDVTRLLDADFLFFLAAAGWGVNAGLALFFLSPRTGEAVSGGGRGFWITVATAFLAVAAVSGLQLLGYYGPLLHVRTGTHDLAHGCAAVAVLCSLGLVPQRFGGRLRRRWASLAWGAAALAAAAFFGVPGLVTGWWTGAAAVAGGAVIVMVTGWSMRRPGERGPSGTAIDLALGVMLLALGLVFSARHLAAAPWNAPAGGAHPGEAVYAWQGAVLAATAALAFALVWRTYLAACTLPQIQARRGMLGMRPVFLLPMLEVGVLCLGSAWFIASSEQAEAYAGRRMLDEGVMTVAAETVEARAGATGEDAAPALRRFLDRVVQRSTSFSAAVAWAESPSGRSELLAAVTRARAPVPFDAAALLPSAADLPAARSTGRAWWVHGTSAFERAVVSVPIAERAGWHLSLAIDSPDLAGLVATHRLQALAIFALAVVIVAIAAVYSVRTRNEAELRLLKESAEAENHGRNAFLGMISHEIRTPLQSVLGYAELAEGTGLSEAAARHVRAIRAQGSILLRIVQDILDFSALRGGGLALNPEVVSLRELLDDVQRGMAGRAQAKGIVFSTEIDGTVPPWVLVDRVRLAQVLLNLAVNAVKFTNRGGVRLAVGCTGVADGRAAIEILVSDTGPGINPAQMRRLFEPFRKMRDDDTPGGGGVGLGLAISRQIVELLGGAIEVESVDGEGSVFRLRLQLAVAPGPVPEQVRQPGTVHTEVASIPSLAGLHVLLIDDNPYVRDLLRDFLHRLGAGVVVRADGTSGLEACGQEPFDVVLLDLRLPDFQGAELAARLRAAGRSPTDPWIVGISAGVSDAEIQATLERGVNDFLLKPVSMAGLAETIRMSPAAAKITPAEDRIAAAEVALSADQRAAFFAELEPMFDRLEQSCLEEQGARLGAEAHYLANGCLVTGFDDGLQVCREIEQLAEAGAFEAARQRIAALRRRFAAGGTGARGA